MQVEWMNAAMFSFGVSLSHVLDDAFGLPRKVAVEVYIFYENVYTGIIIKKILLSLLLKNVMQSAIINLCIEINFYSHQYIMLHKSVGQVIARRFSARHGAGGSLRHLTWQDAE